MIKVNQCVRCVLPWKFDLVLIGITFVSIPIHPLKNCNQTEKDMAYLTVETSRETCNSSAPSTIIEGLATILLAFSEMEIDYHHSSKYSQTETMRKQRMYIFQYLLVFWKSNSVQLWINFFTIKINLNLLRETIAICIYIYLQRVKEQTAFYETF